MAVAYPERFATTQWAMVLQAARTGDDQFVALEQLCRAYWFPIYAHVRRRGLDSEAAKDLTQEFFTRLLGKNWLEGIVPAGGRFRSFLLVAVNRFLANEHDRAHAKKRGGDLPILPLEIGLAESQYAQEPKTTESPEVIFDRRWALALLDQALTRLHRELTAAGRQSQFEMLHPFLSNEPDAGEYDSIASRLGQSRGTVAVAVHRLRHRYREIVREEIASTLAEPGLVEEEMRHLLAALRG